MAVGRNNYELKATFAAETDSSVDRSFKSMQDRLRRLEKRLEKLDGKTAKGEVYVDGYADTIDKIDRVEGKMDDFDGKKATGKLDVDKKLADRKLASATKDLQMWGKEPATAELNLDVKSFTYKLERSEKKLQAAANRAYDAKLYFETIGDKDAYSDAEKLHNQLERMSNERYQLRMELKGASEAAAQSILLKRQLAGVEGTYTVNINTDSVGMAAARMRAFITSINQAGSSITMLNNLGSRYARSVYIMQQATAGLRFSMLGLAAAAAGPLLASLSILGGTLATVGGGMGLVAAAAIPLISHFSKAAENAQALKTAESELATAQKNVASAAQSAADAQRGVSDAYRAGQESIRSAVQAHADAVRGIADAQREYQDALRGVGEAERQAHEGVVSAIEAHKDALEAVDTAQEAYADSQEAAAEATENVAEATEDYNTALATEQYRLATLRNDVKGMALAQEQLALDMKQAEKDLAEAETPMERREAELRIQELQLQQDQSRIDMAQKRKELQDAELNGTSELQSAEEARTDALKAQSDAQEDVRDAQQGIVDAQRDALEAEKQISVARQEGQRQIAEAQRAVLDAQRNVQDAMRAEQEAQRGIETARADASRQMADAQRAMAEANRALADAQKEASAKQAALNALMSKAPQHIAKVEAAVKRFKEAYSAAFASAQAGTSRLAERLINMGTNALPSLGRAANETVQGMNRALTAIQGNFARFGVLKSLQNILKSMPGITNNWTRAFGNFAGAAVNIWNAMLPQIRQFSEWARRVSLNLLKWTDSEAGRKRLKAFFESAAPVAGALFRWIMRIVGGLIAWGSKVENVRNLVAVINFLGRTVMFVGRVVGWVIKQLSRIGHTEGGWIKVVGAIIAVRVALMILRRIAVAAFIAIVRGAVRTSAQGFGALARGIASVPWRKLPQMAGQAFMYVLRALKTLVGMMKMNFWRGLLAMVVQVARAGWSIASIFARAGSVIFRIFGGVFGLVITAVITFVGEIFRHIIPMWQGMSALGYTWKDDMTTMLWALVRTVGGSIAKALLKALMSPFQLIFGIMAKMPGHVGETGRRMNQEIDTNLNSWRNKISGQTAMAAKQANANTSKMENQTAADYKSMGTNAARTTEGMKKNTNADFSAMMEDVKGKTGGMKGASNANFKGLQMGGNDELSKLLSGTNTKTSDMLGSVKGKTTEMKNSGIGNFKGYNIGGQGETEKLKQGAMTKSQFMEMKVTQANVTMKEKGLEALTNLQENGNNIMTDLQQDWVDKAWKTAVYTQESFNAILAGMAKFIEESGVSGVSKPSQIPIKGNPHGDMMGSGQDTGSSGKFSTNVRKGGEFRYAQGGTQKAQGPHGGVARGTTRVYGEVPGTTEYYITDNPRYRKRNMQLLADANRHMFNARGNTMKFAAGGMLPPKGVLRNASSNGTVGYTAAPNAVQLAQAGAAMWRGLVKAGGGNVNVIIKDLPGAIRGLSSSDGTLSLDPMARDVAAAHEFGHMLGLGHGGNSIMGGAGVVTPNDFAALKQYYGVTPPGASSTGSSRPTTAGGGSSRSGGTPPGTNYIGSIGGIKQGPGDGDRQIYTKTQSNNIRSTAGGGTSSGGSAGGGGGGGPVYAEDGSRIRNPNQYYGKRGGGGGGPVYAEDGSRIRNPNQYYSKSSSPSAKPDNGVDRANVHGIADKVKGLSGTLRRDALSRVSAALKGIRKFATGGVMETEGRYTNPGQNLRAAERAYSLGERHHATGGVYRGGELRNAYGSQNWVPEVANIVDQTHAKFPGLYLNTYPNHGGRGLWGEQHSVDHWPGSDAGGNLDDALGDQIVSWQLSNHEDDIMYYIWKGTIHGWGESKPYSGYGGAHYDHVHTTYDMGTNYEGSGSLGNGAGSSVDYGAMYDKHVPKMPTDINYGKVGDAAMAAGNKIRDKHREEMLKKTGLSDWDGSGSLDEWLKQGIVYANAGFEPTSSNISTLHGRAMQESGGDPSAVNNWDSNAAAGTPSKGLLQVIEPTWNAWMNKFGQSTGAFDQNWDDPIRNTATAVRYMKGQYGHIVGASGTGYANGGVTRTPHMGIVGEKSKNEVMWPLGNHRATRAISNAFEQSRGASSQADLGSDRVNVEAPGAIKEPPIDPAKIDELIAATRANKPDAQEIADMVLRAIWAGLESAKGAEKMDESLGRRWTKDAKTKGEI